MTEETNIAEENKIIESENAVECKDLADPFEELEQNKDRKIHYLYKITNKVNNKVYIGQSLQPRKRWHQHKRDMDKPYQKIGEAIKKYGVDNFEFEVIACALSPQDADEGEKNLIIQYDSLIQNGKGYNIVLGGSAASRNAAWKAGVKSWRESLSDEQRQELSRKLSEATKKQIMTKGHPAQGHKWTDEQKERYSKWRSSLDKDSIYTEEVRKKMSESHKGKKFPKEQLEKMAAGIKATWEKKAAIRYATEEIYCHADGCTVAGKAKYRVIDNVRYCKLHGSRLLRNGILEVLPKKPVVVTEEMRKKISENRKGKGCGRVPHNKTILTEEQERLIVTDPRSIEEMSKFLSIGKKVIYRIRKQHKNKLSA